MAVFTTFKRESLARYLVMYDLGELAHFEAIQGGIENSNYFVHLEEAGELSEYVLTIAESVSFDEIPFFNDLMSHLYHHGLPVPAPQRTLDGMTNTIFCGRPTSLFPRLPGSHPDQLTGSMSHSIGVKLAELHEAAKGARYHRSNPYSSTWIHSTLNEVKDRVSDSDSKLLHEIADQYLQFDQEASLPRGIIHGDLFRDNALFVDEELTGIIDFYHACEDYLIQDVAITINDWCTTDSGEFDPEHEDAIISGYQSVRELSKDELANLDTFKLFASLRFFLKRLSSGEVGSPLKDPEVFLKIARNLTN